MVRRENTRRKFEKKVQYR